MGRGTEDLAGGVAIRRTGYWTGNLTIHKLFPVATPGTAAVLYVHIGQKITRKEFCCCASASSDWLRPDVWIRMVLTGQKDHVSDRGMTGSDTTAHALCWVNNLIDELAAILDLGP